MTPGQQIAASFERHLLRARREFPQCSDCEQRLIAIGRTEEQHAGQRPVRADQPRRFPINRLPRREVA